MGREDDSVQETITHGGSGSTEGPLRNITNGRGATQSMVGSGTIITNQTSTTATNQERRLLEYPRNFFDRQSGAGPANEEQAKRFWMYRKARRMDGLADTEEEPDGKAMMLEIKQIRDSLREFVFNSYMDGLQIQAKKMNLLIKGQSSHPVTLLDFRTLLNELESTAENQRLVFELIHLFSKDRHWLAAVIDKWMLQEGMCLAPLQKAKFINGKRTRSCPTDRGGFSAVARSAKSQIVGGLMSSMMRNAGWSVSLTKGQGKNNSYEDRVNYSVSHFFYVVVKMEKVRQFCRRFRKRHCMRYVTNILVVLYLFGTEGISKE